MKQKIVVLTGAGVSAESGFATFRDTGGLWEQYDVNDVASIEGWYRNRKLVLDFYNQRREQLKDTTPSRAWRRTMTWMSSPRTWTTCTSAPVPRGCSTCTAS